MNIYRVIRLVSFFWFRCRYTQALAHIFQEFFQLTAEADRVGLGMIQAAACFRELRNFLTRAVLNLLQVRRGREALPLPHSAT